VTSAQLALYELHDLDESRSPLRSQPVPLREAICGQIRLHYQGMAQRKREGGRRPSREMARPGRMRGLGAKADI